MKKGFCVSETGQFRRTGDREVAAAAAAML